ncbi:MAG: Dabb family protein [Myxococcales bacterium]|nr:Dabb family protein [Myxococcales bacterium]
MVHRYVFVKLKDEGKRQEVADAALAALSAVPVVTGVHVGTPADEAASVWDLVFEVRFSRYEDVAVYAVDPIHVAFVQDVLTPNAEVKKAWNFTVRSAP